MNILVSIITPTYNHEKFIGACIESVLKQTYTNWEMIIIDDGSTDRTPEIIKSFADSRIKYIRQNHIGIYQLGATYNKALSVAQGEIIAILEGDDYISNHKLERQIPVFDEPEVVLSYCDRFGVNETGKIFAEYKVSSFILNQSIRENRPVGSALKKLLIPDSFFTQAVTVCIRKQVLLKIGGFIQSPNLPTIDVPTFCHIALEGEFRYIPEALGYWRKHSKNTTMMELSKLSICYEYSIDFLAKNQERINNLNFDIKIDNLKEELEKTRNKFNLGIDYIKGAKHLEILEMKQARGCFLQYLKRRKKRFKLGLMSLVGILFSYLGIDLINPIKLMISFIKRCLKV